MSGVTKHIYDNDIYSINIMWNKQLKQIEKILPYTYDERIFINYICLFDYLFISSQMSAKPYFIGSTGILLLW